MSTKESRPRTEAANRVHETAASITRRREAALRLPPLACGCRDPLSPTHLARRCRWRKPRHTNYAHATRQAVPRD